MQHLTININPPKCNGCSSCNESEDADTGIIFVIKEFDTDETASNNVSKNPKADFNMIVQPPRQSFLKDKEQREFQSKANVAPASSEALDMVSPAKLIASHEMSAASADFSAKPPSVESAGFSKVSQSSKMSELLNKPQTDDKPRPAYSHITSHSIKSEQTLKTPGMHDMHKFPGTQLPAIPQIPQKPAMPQMPQRPSMPQMPERPFIPKGHDMPNGYLSSQSQISSQTSQMPAPKEPDMPKSAYMLSHGQKLSQTLEHGGLDMPQMPMRPGVDQMSQRPFMSGSSKMTQSQGTDQYVYDPLTKTYKIIHYIPVIEKVVVPAGVSYRKSLSSNMLVSYIKK